MPPASSPSMDLPQLRDELAYQQTLLKSLENETDAEELRQEVCKIIESLEGQIAEMQPSLPFWGSGAVHQTPTDHTHSSRIQSPTGLGYLSPNTPTVLPSRKRPRNAFDDAFEAIETPETKFLRTPTQRAVSPARSVDSFGTDFSDDSILKGLLGNTYTEEKKNTEQYLRNLERKRKQEEEDAEFARSLARDFEREAQPKPSQPKPALPDSNYSQSLLRPNRPGFQKPAPSIAEPEFEPRTNLSFQYPNTSFTSGTSTPDSDDSGLEEITSNEWSRKFGPVSSRTLPPMMTSANPYQNIAYNGHLRVPGAFPTMSYASSPGASVYGISVYNTSQYNSSTSSLNNLFNPQLNGSLAGSSRMPFDLENYPLPSALTYLDPEQTQEEIKDLLKQIRPDEELTAEQLAEIQPEGLKVNLMPHQRKGYAWMKSMEEGTNKGGILADDMGLGKTIQALSLILGRPPLDKDGRRLNKPTLIVAPVALMQQWQREASKMVRRSHQLEVLILHGSNRNSSWNDIKQYDIVLTTYGTLATDLKRKEMWDKHLKMMPDAKPKPRQLCPVLGNESKFHRIILDEAQNIKNKSAKAAHAACQVQAEYRWCLTGTPMQNNVDEIYSLIKFCRIRPYCDAEKFGRDIGRPLRARGIDYRKEKAMQQLQAVLRAILLRRTKKSEIDGQPILQLPEKHTVEDRAVFDKDELSFYKALESQAQIQFNRFMKNNSIGRHYSHALVLLLRLRQCCCSPLLVKNAKDFLINGAIKDLDFVENARLLSAEVVNRLSDLEAFECPVCMDGVENPVIFNPCGHSLCQECLSTMVDKAIQEDRNSRVTCPHCRAEIDTNKVTDHESFLRVHFPDRPGVQPIKEDGSDDDGADATDDDSSSDEDDDDSDDDGEDLKDFVVPDDGTEYDSDEADSPGKKLVKKVESDDDSDTKTRVVKENDSDDDFETVTKSIKSSGKAKEKSPKHKFKDGKGKAKKKGKSKQKSKPSIRSLAQLRVEGLKNKAAKKKYLKRVGRGYQPSAKILKTIELLQQIRDNGEGEKTIIFSSFTSFLDLLEVGINRAGDEELTEYTRYDGSMSTKDRNEAVIQFTDDPKCKTILVSLKAGNSGLNLTVANHVIIIDPFWNPFVEYQAADRCYRIGQLKEVTIHRVLIGEGDEDGNVVDHSGRPDYEFTVEDRILALQEKKRALVETALDETASGNIGRLGVRELGYLFGVNSLNG